VSVEAKSPGYDTAGAPGALSAPSLGERLRRRVLKSPDASGERVVPKLSPTDAAEADTKLASDKERLIGLIAAPIAAGIGLLVTDSLIANDPAPRLADGLPNKLHVDIGLYHEVFLAVLALSVIVLVTSWFRKRLFAGIGLALIGLAIFNLRFWGFGIPFLVCGSWFVTRSYRLNQRLRALKGEPRGGLGFVMADAKGDAAARPRPNKRYTPPRTFRRT
jgi:hypothetical protein